MLLKILSIIRCANTGISGLIHPDGKIIEQTNWDEEIGINVKVPLNEKVTFYNRYGDFIGRISSFVTVLLQLYGKKKNYKNEQV